jgi:hypothetical protein
MKLLCMQLSPVSCYLHLLRTKWLLQQTLSSHTLSLHQTLHTHTINFLFFFFVRYYNFIVWKFGSSQPLCTHNNRHYSSVCFNFCISTQQTEIQEILDSVVAGKT